MLSDVALRQLRLELSRQYPLVGEGLHIGTRNLQGYEIGEARPYQYGDSWRQIDHRLTARTTPRTLMIRQRLVEHDVSAEVIADLSKRSAWGGAEAVMLGTDVIRAAVQAVCYILESQGDAYGIHLLGSPLQSRRPSRGKQHYRQLMALIKDTPVSERDMLAGHLAGLDRVRHRKELLVVVSDFLAEGWEEPFMRLARRHEVIAIQVLDPWDLEMPNLGPIWVRDPRSGKPTRLNTGKADVRERYHAAAAAQQAERVDLFREVKAHHMLLDTRGNWLDQLVQALQHRQSRRAA